jgi:hypothetical protein
MCVKYSFKQSFILIKYGNINMKWKKNYNARLYFKLVLLHLFIHVWGPGSKTNLKIFQGTFLNIFFNYIINE